MPGHRRTASVPLLGRARHEVDLQDHDDRRRRPRGLLERQRGVSHQAGRRSSQIRVRAHHEDVDLPAGIHRGTVRGHRPGGGPRDTDPCHRPPGQPASHRRGAGKRSVLLRVPVRLLRDPVPGAQARSHRHPRLRRRGDGERGSDHLPRRLHRARPRQGEPG